MKSKKAVSVSYVLMLMFLIGTMANRVNAQEVVSAQDMEYQLLGKWIIKKPLTGTTGGYLIFDEDNQYEKHLVYSDGSEATRKGSYVLDTSVSPVRLLLGPVDLEESGADLVSEFCILRFHTDAEIELRFSTTGAYPKEFAPKGGEYTMVLSR